MARYQNPVPQYFDGSGNVVSFGEMSFFKSKTNTNLDTFADNLLTIKNTNPVLLDGAGRLPNVFFEGSAKAVLKDSSGTQIFERDPIGAENITGDFALYDSLIIYSVNIINDPLTSTDSKNLQAGLVVFNVIFGALNVKTLFTN